MCIKEGIYKGEIYVKKKKRFVCIKRGDVQKRKICV